MKDQDQLDVAFVQAVEMLCKFATENNCHLMGTIAMYELGNKKVYIKNFNSRDTNPKQVWEY